MRILMLILMGMTSSLVLSGDVADPDIGELSELGKLVLLCREETLGDESPGAMTRCLKEHGMKEDDNDAGAMKLADDCGSVYLLRKGDKKTFRKSKAEFCDVFYEADGNTDLKITCKKFNLGYCTEEFLYLLADVDRESIYCGKRGPRGEKFSDWVYMAYGRLVKTRGSKFVCTIKGIRGRNSKVKVGANSAQAIGCSNACGKAPSGAGLTNIVGEQDVTDGKYPWMAFLDISSSDGTSFCGGAIVTKRHVVTAAHCLDFNDLEITVRVGEYNLNANKDNAQNIQVSDMKQHLSYDPESQANDVAILTLSEDIEWTDSVGPVCLPPKSSFEDRLAIVVGWGSLEDEGDCPSKLQEAAVSVTSLSDKYICASDSGKHVYRGDSGSMLFIREEGAWILIGIDSHSNSCANEDYQAAFTRVSSYNAWILSQVSSGSC